MTTEKKQEIINRLFAEQCSCIICNNHEIRLFHERGVKDIYRLLKEEPDFLNGSFIADKVIGKAAAALMILGGVKEVFAGVISRPALSLFQSHGIEPEYKIETEYIINRTRTGWCPLESRCKLYNTQEVYDRHSVPPLPMFSPTRDIDGSFCHMPLRITTQCKQTL